MCTSIVALLILFTSLVAYRAWHDTPDMYNFRQFAEPPSTRSESKESYLLSPVGLQAVGVVIAVGAYLGGRTRPRSYDWYFPFYWTLWTFLLFFLELVVGSRALMAAGHSPLRLLTG